MEKFVSSEKTHRKKK